MHAITIKNICELKAKQEKIAMLTCYDAAFAQILAKNGVEILLIGDSLGNVIQGHNNTLPVNIEHIVYHTTCVARANTCCFLVADMPFGTYNNEINAYQNAVKLIKAGAHMVKVEGGAWISGIVNYLYTRGIPVCSHLGLTPQ